MHTHAYIHLAVTSSLKLPRRFGFQGDETAARFLRVAGGGKFSTRRRGVKFCGPGAATGV